MRGLKIASVSASLVLGSFGIAQANTFDGTNHNPEYMTGITNVYGVSNQQIEFYAPVYSFDACIHEDGSSQDACVWHSPTRGNMSADVSVVKLGGEVIAQISHEAARILLKPSEVASVPVSVPETVEAPPVVSDVPKVSEERTEPLEPVREDVPVQAVERVEVEDNDSVESNNVITEGWEDEGNKVPFSDAELTTMTPAEFERHADKCMNEPEYYDRDCTTFNFRE